VVPGEHHDANPSLTEIGEGGEHAKGRTRDDVLPLEPEVEQIAVDDERSRAAPQ
jgi:hypothetical protein